MASEWNELIHILSSFIDFSISFIIAKERNVRADILAKGARSENSIFLPHVDSEIPKWLV